MKYKDNNVTSSLTLCQVFQNLYIKYEFHGSQLRAFSREHSTQPLPRRQGSDRNKLHGARSLFKFLLLKI